MHRITLPILAAIAAFIILHLYSMGGKSIAPPIGYSGSIKMINHGGPMNNISGLRFPSCEDKKYIYVFILDGDKLNYKRYDIQNGKEININLPKNKDLFICVKEKNLNKAKLNTLNDLEDLNLIDENGLNKAHWSWHSNFIDLNLKGKFAKSANQQSTSSYAASSRDIKGEEFCIEYFQFFGQSKGVEKISLVYGEERKDYLKVPVAINVE